MGKSNLKPVICILNPDDKYYLQNDSNCTDSLPYCVTIKDVRDLKNRGVDIPDIYVKENTILTQLPGKDKYIFRKPEDENSMIESRIKTVGDILSYLGAKSCSISFYSSNKADSDSHVGVGVNVGVNGKAGDGTTSAEQGVDVDTKVNVNNSQSFVNEMRLLSVNQWPGNYTEEGYKRAKELALESGLDEDPGIKSLLEQRNPCHPSPVSSSRYKIELYSSMKKSLEIATNIQVGVSKSLNLPMGAGASGSVNVGINVNVEKNSYAENREIMDMQVEFGPYIPKKATAVEMGKATSLQSTNGSMSTGKLVAIIIGAVVVAVCATIAAMKFLLV